MKRTLIYRVKSEGQNTYMNARAYNELTVNMSTSDYAAHIAIPLMLTEEQTESIRMRCELGLVELHRRDGILVWFCFDMGHFESFNDDEDENITSDESFDLSPFYA